MREWLTAVGFGHCADAFEAEGVTLEIAATLTDADLVALGLTRIGDRRRFQAAARALQAAQDAAASLRGPGDASGHPGFAHQAHNRIEFPPAPSRGSDASFDAQRRGPGVPPLQGMMERRPLTLMFVDVVGSTALLERWGDEAFQAMLLRYRQIGADACQRFGGQVYRYLGDGILAYFCYPHAHENDPERAVRAALEITRAMPSMPAFADGVPLAVRIGIATGRVIIGDMFSPGAVADWSSVIGSAPNLAAKLQVLAPPNGILVSGETQAKIAGRFELRDRGLHDIAGFAAPVPVWQVLGTHASAGRRLEAVESPLQGREAELERLEALWRCAEAGRGGGVLIVGEPGIGKSRLLRHVLDLRAAEGVRIIRLAGSALDADTPLEPFLAQLRTSAALDPADPPERARENLAAVLRGTAETRETALPLLCELLGIEPAALPVPQARGGWRPGLSPDRLRALSLSVLVGQIQEAATDRPAIVVVEDLHWFDPTSREALVALLTDRAARRMLVLVTSREGPPAEQVAGVCDAVLPLGPLGREQQAELVRNLAVGVELGPRIVQAILARSEGVPLFVEEFTRALLLQGRGDPHGFVAPGKSGFGAPGYEADEDALVPGSIDELLAERLDRAGEAKGVAQAASVFGTQVRRALLVEALRLRPPALEARLGELLRAGVLKCHGTGEEETWCFAHVLLRDAAYNSLVAERRRELHGRAVLAIEAVDPSLPERQPALFAHHLAEAGRTEDAARFWIEAGRRALARSALDEATRVLRRGLSALERLPPEPQVLESRVEAMALLGPALMAVHGSGSAIVRDLYTEAYALCERLPEARSHFPIYWGWWRQSGDFALTEQRSRQLLARAQARGDPELLLQAHHCSWASDYHQGELCGCLEHIATGLELYERHDFRDHARLYGNHDPKVCAHGNRAQAFWLMGRPSSALAEERQASLWVQELQHLGSRVHAIDMELLHAVYRRDVPRVVRLARMLTDCAVEHGLPDYLSKARIFAGWADAELADPVRGLAMLEDGFARQRDIGTKEDFLIYYTLLGEALARAGRPERAVEQLLRARSELSEAGMLFWMPEIYRMIGDMTLLVDPRSVERAADEYAYAQMLATRQGASMLALRAAAAAARLELREGLIDQAAARLSGARAAVVELDGGPDLSAADLLASRIQARRLAPARHA